MARNGSGTYSLPAGNPVVTGTVISSTVQNNTMSDIATALTNSIAKDGQTTPTANLPMGGFKFTNIGNGSAATDSISLGQAQGQAYLYLSSVAGTDTITASTNPVTSSYVASQTFRFVAAGSNTGAATININSLGAKSITKNGTSALVAGDIVANCLYQITYDGTQFQLLNPGVNVAADSITSASLADSALGVSMVNGTLTASVGSSALTIAIKTKAGVDPSASDPVLVYFRNATAGTGDYTVISVTAATSIVVSSGSTLGTISTVPSRIWVVGFNDAGTFRLGVANITNYLSIGDDVIASSTAEGGAGAADSANTFYTGTAVTSKAMRVLGYVESTQATAGTWATSPSKVQLVSNLYDTVPPTSTGQLIYRLDSASAGANVNTVQSLFGVGVTLSGSTVYDIEMVFVLVKSAGTTSHTIGIGFGGTASINNIGYKADGIRNAAAASIETNYSGVFGSSASNTTITAAISSAAQTVMFTVKGSVSINAGGTFIPQYTLSAAPGGAYTTQIGSYVKLTRQGASGANTNIGNWS